MRTIGSFEIPILMLAFASTFLVYSINPFSMTDTTFTENFPMNESITFHWVGYATLLVAVASIWIAYIFTKDEVHAIKKITTFEDEPKSWFAKIGFHHFYLNDLYHIIFVEPFVGSSYLITEKNEISSKETKRYFFENKGLSYYFHLFDSQWIDKLVDSVAKGTVKLSAVFQEFEKLVVDGFVNAVANWVRTVGAYTRQFQGGNIQMYLTSLFALVVLFILLILGL
jgi:NADH-quinone oxidoreductase subunit L